MDTSVSELSKQKPLTAGSDHDPLHVQLTDGREIATPLWWYPSLFQAIEENRQNMQLMVSGIHRPDLDERLSIAGMLRGWRCPDAIEPAKAAE